MECPFCEHSKVHKHGQTSNGNQRYLCPDCAQTFTETLDTLYYRRQISPEKIEQTLQAHSEGMSLRGISRQTKLAYETVVSIIRKSSEKAQMVHNDSLTNVETGQIDGDEMWSFVQKNKNTAFRKS